MCIQSAKVENICSQIATKIKGLLGYVPLGSQSPRSNININDVFDIGNYIKAAEK